MKAERILGIQMPLLPCHAIRGDIIGGGEILSQIDLCAGLVASRVRPQRELGMVTRVMNAVQFPRAVRVGDVLYCYGNIENIGRTSVLVKVEVEVLRKSQFYKVTEATAVFVAVDKNGKPTPINEDGGRFSLSSLRPFIQIPGRPERLMPPAMNMPVADGRIICLKKVMMPNETNGMGKIFGGRLMAFMEGAGAFLAEQSCENPGMEACVTRFMDGIEFRQAVEVNDILTCYGNVIRIGQTSIAVHVEAEVERRGIVIPVTSAKLVFVAVDQSGAKISVTSI